MSTFVFLYSNSTMTRSYSFHINLLLCLVFTAMLALNLVAPLPILQLSDMYTTYSFIVYYILDYCIEITSGYSVLIICSFLLCSDFIEFTFQWLTLSIAFVFAPPVNTFGISFAS